MIKYVELTAPEASAYRQAKILSIECKEGDRIRAGDTLFIVQSGNTKLALPSTKDGRIVEFIVSEQQNITLSTALLLLETEVDASTATPPQGDASEQVNSSPTANANNKSPKKASSNGNNNKKKHEQQSLDLQAGLETTPESTLIAAGDALVASKKENKPMSDTQLLTVNVPDIGADSAKVIEILVKVGDHVEAEDALVTLESDKASMDVPSPHGGTVKSISVLIDQDVSEGTVLLELEASEGAAAPVEQASAKPEQSASNPEPSKPVAKEPQPTASASSETTSVSIPDIGGDSAKVVEILVSVGDSVDVEDALVTLESDKASMDVPSSAAGIIESIEVKIDEDVSEGTVVVTLKSTGSAALDNAPVPATTAAPSKETEPPATPASPSPAPTNISSAPVASTGASHASPSIRRFARELGVDLTKVDGTGRKSRVTKDDVKAFVKGVMTQPAAASVASTGGAGIPQVPAQDFSKFGEIEVTPLNKIKRLTASNLHRSWLNVPHVTHKDESNINDLEAFRKKMNAEYQKQNKPIKLSPLAFIVKAVVNALQTYPQFNSSIEPGGENLIMKKYFHIGIAVDTPNGLVVPVIRDADTKSVAQIAAEMGELAAKARDKKLTMNDMSGACFTISSLGGIGGTSFTPIVNAPEVAILGVSRSKIQPVWNGEDFIPGMMLPLSLSYDHRVIDGAEAARFTRHIAEVLEDLRRLTV